VSLQSVDSLDRPESLDSGTCATTNVSEASALLILSEESHSETRETFGRDA